MFIINTMTTAVTTATITFRIKKKKVGLQQKEIIIIIFCSLQAYSIVFKDWEE